MIDVCLCVAEDSEKYKYNFFEKFAELDIENSPTIYGASGLPDPDSFSEILYDFYVEFWNTQRQKFVLDIPEIKKIWNGSSWELVGTNNETFRLGTDSIVSIYWHWKGNIYPYKNMQQLIEKISTDIQDRNEYKTICQKFAQDDTNHLAYSPWKKFIWHYLQKSNTIGGFLVFPRHINSINQQRGKSALINDRFDLTLECIRRSYQNGDFSRNTSNPLFGMSEEDKAFFNMFGTGEKGFETYIKFFCLNSWVNKNFTGVYDLLSAKNELSSTDWPKEILPCDFKDDQTQIESWWTFYNNIMQHLKNRNKQIAELIK